jgi:hypothetical protein
MGKSVSIDNVIHSIANFCSGGTFVEGFSPEVFSTLKM